MIKMRSTCLAGLCLAALASPGIAAAAGGETLGFVVSLYADVIPDNVEGGCPEGLNTTEDDQYGVSFRDWAKEAKKIGPKEASEKYYSGNACRERGSQKDPGFRTFQADLPVAGLDLDGMNSKKTKGGECAHDDFRGPDGKAGIDNQHWRLLGCTKGYQPDGQMDRMWESGNFIKEGIPILIEVRGIDDRENDDEVEVRILSSAGTVTIDGSGKVVPHTSLAEHDQEKYRNAPSKGKIENGVLTSEPADVRLHIKQQVIDTEFYYRDARIRAELTENGLENGILGFFWDGDNFYKAMNDHYIGTFHSGRIGALTRGYSCAGMDYALPTLMDGHPDPESGECTSLSSAIHFEAVPAFVIPGKEPKMAQAAALSSPGDS